jgi:hypothetical protein
VLQGEGNAFAEEVSDSRGYDTDATNLQLIVVSGSAKSISQFFSRNVLKDS